MPSWTASSSVHAVYEALKLSHRLSVHLLAREGHRHKHLLAHKMMVAHIIQRNTLNFTEDYKICERYSKTNQTWFILVEQSIFSCIRGWKLTNLFLRLCLWTSFQYQYPMELKSIVQPQTMLYLYTIQPQTMLYMYTTNSQIMLFVSHY